MAKKLEIYYKPPTYSRDNYPRFAHELVERIVDFLWDDPRAFAGCCLVCHAWYCATRPLFPTMADDHRFIHKETFEAVPRLSANTSLEELDLALCLPSSPQIIQRALEALLSDITSPRLRRISLSIWLNQSKILQDANEVPVSPADTTKSIPTFHAVLSRGIYDRLPKNGVDVYFSMSKVEPEAKHIMSGIKFHIFALFAPWLARNNVLKLKFDPDPDRTSPFTLPWVDSEVRHIASSNP
ncbi:uncharacterized protein B0H18DRAFT_1131795 [Fomitopsis serialis]|uniref:uncharacterized protein n=1 Tax=Fomitopsis serialis TaxID=139415 RepID=UPI0020081C44|nr:uncharacterized protein B0H18DRAFT_1131795 [Neoantrodia serialis]KAH9907092.1 hypothetical protein B0H18DRAFT_1131795 [Neoantrodia serialis]